MRFRILSIHPVSIGALRLALSFIQSITIYASPYMLICPRLMCLAKNSKPQSAMTSTLILVPTSPYQHRWNWFTRFFVDYRATPTLAQICSSIKETTRKSSNCGSPGSLCIFCFVFLSPSSSYHAQIFDEIHPTSNLLFSNISTFLTFHMPRVINHGRLLILLDPATECKS